MPIIGLIIVWLLVVISGRMSFHYDERSNRFVLIDRGAWGRIEKYCYQVLATHWSAVTIVLFIFLTLPYTVLFIAVYAHTH